ncbi:MAG TPA: hypothetical protein VFS21_35090 [Roseiflexaceae bacterium]|nr:hypothetical protein [Roseiflexaceae bacterium]
MDYILGGYYLVEGTERQPWFTLGLLPERFWSISSCICTQYPNLAFLSWSSDARECEAIRTKLGLSSDQYGELVAHVDRLFDEGIFGWPEVWTDVEAARVFRRHYLEHLEHIKLLGIATPAQYYQELLDGLKSTPPGGVVSLYANLQRQEGLPPEARVLGFEILGREAGGSFHSFVCNGLEQEYLAQLGIQLNDHGLIDTLDDAVRASDFTNLDSTGAEPIGWTPWLVFEVSFA